MPKLLEGLRKAIEGEVPPTDDNTATGEEKRIRGKIIKVQQDAGWGFISSHEIKFTRIFFHWSSLKQDTLHFTELQKGMEVEFTPQNTPDKGWRAIRIAVIQAEAEKAAS